MIENTRALIGQELVDFIELQKKPNNFQLENNKLCFFCWAPNSPKRCKKCYASYCNDECQKKDWKRHKVHCISPESFEINLKQTTNEPHQVFKDREGVMYMLVSNLDTSEGIKPRGFSHACSKNGISLFLQMNDCNFLLLQKMIASSNDCTYWVPVDRFRLFYCQLTQKQIDSMLEN